MADLFAGFDVSTRGVKLVVIEPDGTGIVHTNSVGYDEDLPHRGTVGGVVPGLGEGVCESEPDMWTEAVGILLSRLQRSGADPADLRCISVSGQQHGLVALDGDGGLARPRAKLWNDHSTAQECRLLTEAIGGPEEMLAEVGNTQRPGYTAPKILHLLRTQPEVWERTAVFLLPHDYVNWWLTGGVVAAEEGDASGTALWDPVRGAWSDRLIAAISPDLARRLPPVGSSMRTIGTVSEKLAVRYGLRSDCRVDAGSGDNMYGAVGTGNVQPGILTVSLGTSGTAYTVTSEPFVDPEGEIAAFRDSTGRHLPLLCVSNMANGYEAVRQRYGLDHDGFEAAAASRPPGNIGRVVVPWYEGERTPDLPEAAPVLFGFGAGDLEPGPLCRGVLEGHILNLWSGASRLPVRPRVIHVTGGLSRSRLWCQAIADIFEVEAVPIPGEGAALGAAIHAAWDWYREAGRERPLEALTGALVVPDEPRRCGPAPQDLQTYRRLKGLYTALSRRIRGLEGEDVFALRRQMSQRPASPEPRG